MFLGPELGKAREGRPTHPPLLLSSGTAGASHISALPLSSVMYTVPVAVSSCGGGLVLI